MLTPRDKALMAGTLRATLDQIGDLRSVAEVRLVLQVAARELERRAVIEALDTAVVETTMDEFARSVAEWNRQHAPGRKDPPL